MDKDFWAFRKMITPSVIVIIFWIGVVVSVLGGLGMILVGLGKHQGMMAFKGLLLIPLGPILTRVYCELLMVVFRINGTLTEILHEVQKKDKQNPEG